MRPPITISEQRPAVAKTQENEDVRPVERQVENADAIDEALAWHDGDARATIATLLADCAYLRHELEAADAALSRGFTRGWRPRSERD